MANPFTEKRTQQLPPVRVGEMLETALHRLACKDDRALSEYIRLVLEKHCFGHGLSVRRDGDDRNEGRADQCYAEERANS